MDLARNMNGRSLFAKFGFLISWGCILFSWIPDFLASSLLALTSPFDGRIAALIRYLLLRDRLRRCGENVYFGPRLTLKNIGGISLGNNVSLHCGCYVDGIGGIEVGDDVSIAHYSSLISFDHSWSDANKPIKYNELLLSKIEISSDVWVGCGVRILAGVSIGRRSIVAAGAVVTRNIPSGVIAGGVPANVLRKISGNLGAGQ